MALNGRTARGIPYALVGDQWVPHTDTGQMMGEVDAQLAAVAQRAAQGDYRGALPAGTDPNSLDTPAESGWYQLLLSGGYPNLPPGVAGKAAMLQVQATGFSGEQTIVVYQSPRKWTRRVNNINTQPQGWTDWERLDLDSTPTEITDAATLGAYSAFIGTQFEATGRFSSIPNSQGNAQMLALDNPARVAILELGTSTDGRPIRGYRFGDPSKPAVYFLGMQHGDEPMGKEALLAWGRALGTETITDVCVVIVPFLNVDRMNLTRLNAAGTDLNRNWTTRTTLEVQAAAKVFDDHDVRLVIDCHEGGTNNQLMMGVPYAGSINGALTTQATALRSHLTTRLEGGPYPGAVYPNSTEPGTLRFEVSVAEKAVVLLLESPSLLFTNIYAPDPQTRFRNYINVLGWTLEHFRANLPAYVTATDTARA